MPDSATSNGASLWRSAERPTSPATATARSSSSASCTRWWTTARDTPRFPSGRAGPGSGSWPKSPTIGPRPEGTMRYAIFSDVHANLPALEAFVDASRRKADAYLCLGDVVDYGPWNDECLDLVRELPGIVLLEGNHERLFSGAESIEGKPLLARLFFETSRRFFTRESALLDLPNFVKIGDYGAQHTIGDLRLYADTPLLEVAGKHFIGHTHYQFRRDFPGGGVLVNCGSVGQNRRR